MRVSERNSGAPSQLLNPTLLLRILVRLFLILQCVAPGMAALCLPWRRIYATKKIAGVARGHGLLR